MEALVVWEDKLAQTERQQVRLQFMGIPKIVDPNTSRTQEIKLPPKSLFVLWYIAHRRQVAQSKLRELLFATKRDDQALTKTISFLRGELDITLFLPNSGTVGVPQDLVVTILSHTETHETNYRLHDDFCADTPDLTTNDFVNEDYDGPAGLKQALNAIRSYSGVFLERCTLRVNEDLPDNYDDVLKDVFSIATAVDRSVPLKTFRQEFDARYIRALKKIIALTKFSYLPEYNIIRHIEGKVATAQPDKNGLFGKLLNVPEEEKLADFIADFCQHHQFQGRTGECKKILQHLQHQRSLVLFGPGGCGKTRLIYALMAELHKRYPSGVYRVDLRSAVGQAAMTRIGRVIGCVDRTAESCLRHLNRARCLLILDNADEAGELCHQLIDVANMFPNVYLLVATRHRFSASIPYFELKPFDGEIGINFSDPAKSDSVRLFISSFRTHQAGVILKQEHLASVVQVCQWADGIPLALEMIAAYCRIIGNDMQCDYSTHIIPYTETRFKPHNIPLRFSESIALSLGGLDDRDLSLLRRLSLFKHGWTAANVS